MPPSLPFRARVASPGTASVSRLVFLGIFGRRWLLPAPPNLPVARLFAAPWRVKGDMLASVTCISRTGKAPSLEFSPTSLQSLQKYLVEVQIELASINASYAFY